MRYAFLWIELVSLQKVFFNANMLDGGEAMTPDITTLSGSIGRLELGDPTYFLMFSYLLLPQLRRLTITILCQNTQLLECI